jgi:transcriptional regulator with XRE-family HTH domain
MRKRTHGARLLSAFLEAHGLRNADAARALGVSDPTIYDWLRGEKRPRGPYRKAIEIWTGAAVSESSWEKDEDRDIVQAVKPFEPSGTGTSG